jgi:hypothetical protein
MEKIMAKPFNGFFPSARKGRILGDAAIVQGGGILSNLKVNFEKEKA